MFTFIFYLILIDFLFYRAINTLARTASSTDKLHDALVSLRFMIEVDVLSQSLTQVQKNTISILFQYLVPLLPEEARSYFSKYYKKLQSTGILSSSTSKNTFQTHKEISIPNNLAESVYGQSLVIYLFLFYTFTYTTIS